MSAQTTPQVYAITGWKGHGKDTFARSVTRVDSSFAITHFATSLKDMASRIFSLTEGQMNDPSQKEVSLSEPIAMDLYLPEMRKETGLDLQPAQMVAQTPRQILQYFGTEYVRAVQDDYWTQKVVYFVNSSPQKKVLIADCRFPNEAAAVRSLGGKIIRVLRLDLPLPEDAHPSEQEIANIEPDLLIGKASLDMSLQTRIAHLLATNQWSSTGPYDHRNAIRAISHFSENGSLVDCARDLGFADVGAVKFVLNYYGYSC